MKLIKGFSKLSYDQRLKSLGLFTLFHRRQRGDLIEIFKILNGYYDINPTTFLHQLLLQTLEATI